MVNIPIMKLSRLLLRELLPTFFILCPVWLSATPSPHVESSPPSAVRVKAVTVESFAELAQGIATALQNGPAGQSLLSQYATDLVDLLTRDTPDSVDEVNDLVNDVMALIVNGSLQVGQIVELLEAVDGALSGQITRDDLIVAVESLRQILATLGIDPASAGQVLQSVMAVLRQHASTYWGYDGSGEDWAWAKFLQDQMAALVETLFVAAGGSEQIDVVTESLRRQLEEILGEEAAALDEFIGTLADSLTSWAVAEQPSYLEIANLVDNLGLLWQKPDLQPDQLEQIVGGMWEGAAEPPPALSEISTLLAEWTGLVSPSLANPVTQFPLSQTVAERYTLTQLQSYLWRAASGKSFTPLQELGYRNTLLDIGRSFSSQVTANEIGVLADILQESAEVAGLSYLKVGQIARGVFVLLAAQGLATEETLPDSYLQMWRDFGLPESGLPETNGLLSAIQQVRALLHASYSKNLSGLRLLSPQHLTDLDAAVQMAYAQRPQLLLSQDDHAALGEAIGRLKKTPVPLATADREMISREWIQLVRSGGLVREDSYSLLIDINYLLEGEYLSSEDGEFHLARIHDLLQKQYVFAYQLDAFLDQLLTLSLSTWQQIGRVLPMAYDTGDPAWKYSAWLGFLSDPNFPWVYHFDFGWMYLVGFGPATAEENLWMFLPGLSTWGYTNHGYFPFVYFLHPDFQDWIFLWKEGDGPFQFYHPVFQQWRSVRGE